MTSMPDVDQGWRSLEAALPTFAEDERRAAVTLWSFCHFVFFFESRESGEAWAAEHEGTFVLALDEAADLARRLNARTWGDALAEPVAG